MTCSSSPGPATSDGQHLIREAFQLQSLDHLSVQTRTLGSIRRHQWQQLQGIRKVKSSVLLSTKKGVTQRCLTSRPKQWNTWNMCHVFHMCFTKIGSYLVKIRDLIFFVHQPSIKVFIQLRHDFNPGAWWLTVVNPVCSACKAKDNFGWRSKMRLLSGQAIRFASGFQHPETLMKRGTCLKLPKEMKQQWHQLV